MTGRSGPEKKDFGGKYRALQGWTKLLESVLFISMIGAGLFWILEVHLYLGWTPMLGQYLGVFLALGLGAVFISVPARRSGRGDRVPWYDWALFGLGMIIGSYVAVNFPTIQYEVAIATPLRSTMGVVAVLVIAEALRRLTGWSMVIIIFFFIFYALFAGFFPGMLEGKSIEPGELFNYLYLDTNAVFGIPISVASTIVLAFILLGNALSAAGGAKFFMDLSMAILGRYRGGPAKMAVLASSLFGTISGSAVGNVVTTGIITIPMMKKVGFRPEVAGAIEAAASTGGQLMPPVMGAAAFLIAELLAIPYKDVVIAALIPAVLYYLALFIQIDLEAAKYNISGVPPKDLPRIGPVLKSGWPSFLPVIILILALFVLNYRAEKAGMAAVFSVLVLNLFDRKNRLNGRRYLGLAIGTGRGLLEIAVICGGAGIVIGVLNITGLGFGLSLHLVKTVGQNLFMLLFLSALVCIILGMGMPTVAVYILLAVLVAPALTELGIIPLAAHLFIFYFGMMCMITPPVCLASFAAAAIADTDPMRSGFTSMRLAIVALVVPFLFVLEPSLLLMGSPAKVTLAVFTAVCGCYFLGAGLTGFLFRLLSPGIRALTLAGGIGLLIPMGVGYNIGWITDILGFAIVIPIFLWDRAGARKSTGRLAVK